MSKNQIQDLGAVVLNVPTDDEVTTLIPRIARLWAELHEYDRDLARELLEKLPSMKIQRSTTPQQPKDR